VTRGWLPQRAGSPSQNGSGAAAAVPQATTWHWRLRTKTQSQGLQLWLTESRLWHDVSVLTYGRLLKQDGFVVVNTTRQKTRRHRHYVAPSSNTSYRITNMMLGLFVLYQHDDHRITQPTSWLHKLVTIDCCSWIEWQHTVKSTYSEGSLILTDSAHIHSQCVLLNDCSCLALSIWTWSCSWHQTNYILSLVISSSPEPPRRCLSRLYSNVVNSLLKANTHYDQYTSVVCIGL